MKKILFYSLVILFCGVGTSLSAQQSKKISLQGFLKDANGKAVADGMQEITFKLYTDATTSTVAWEDVQNINVFGGVYSTHLGSVANPVDGLNWGASTYFVGVTVQGIELTPRTELTFAPYSLGSPKAQEVVCSGAVGDVKYSILNPTQFAMQNGDCWVPMDGRTLLVTDKLRIITGLTNVTNAGGLFLRGQEFSGGTDHDPNRDSDSPIASFQDQAYLSHNHNLSLGVSVTGTTSTNGAHTHKYHNANQTGTETDSGTAETYARPNNYDENTHSAGEHSHSVNASGTVSGDTNTRGGDETRPKNINLWTYIRIN